MSLRHHALNTLLTPDPAAKAAQAQALQAECLSHPTLLDDAVCQERLALNAAQQAAMPGRPVRPHLVPAKQVPSRSPFTDEGRAALLHAICHIEFNAINLALDLLVRFPDMPPQFYADWLKVAKEEAYHHTLLCSRLDALGLSYGHYLAHDGLTVIA